MADTPVEVPHPYRREHPTLSEIDLTVPSLRPPAEAAETLARAHAASWQRWREEEAERYLQAENERRISRLKAWGTLVCAVIAAAGAALAAVLEAIK